jgi:small-conductance mechanosensitive channel
MSRGDLQEMEVGTKQSKTAVNANAKAAESAPSLSGATPGQTGSWEDLGGPDPSNYKSTDDSAKLKTPGATLKQVKDIVNKGAKPAMAAAGVKEENEEDDELLEETEEKEEEILEAKKEEEKEEKEKDEDEEEDEEEEVKEEYSIDEDVNALIGNEDLSEEFKEKAKTIFEAALKSKVNEVKEALEAQYEQQLLEEVESIKEEIKDRLDSYLEYVAEEWFTENALAIEHGLKTEMTESFLQGMKGLFEEHYVSIPEDKYDVLDSMVQKLDEMEEKLNEQIEKNISLNKRLAESVADGILDQVSEGLAATQKEKLASLAESVEFESEEEYREKLEMLKESYFPAGKSPSAKTESLSEQVDSSPESMTGTMAAYLKTLSAFSK